MRELKKVNLQLSLILIIQLILVLFVWWPFQNESHSKKSLFSELNWDEIKSITITDQKNNIVLEKVNNQWVVPDQFNFPADSNKVAGIFDKLKSIQPGFVVGQTENSFKRLEVSKEKFQKKISFSKDQGFYLGTSPQFRKIHIRRFEDKEVFSTDQIASYDFPMDSKEWLNKVLLKVDSSKVQSIKIQQGKEQWVFIRKPSGEKDNEKDVWQLDGRTVNKSKFDGILRTLSNLQLDEVLGTEEKKEYGLEKPKAIITVTYEQEGKEMEKTIWIGGQKESNYFAKLVDSSYRVSIPSYQISSMLNANKKDFFAVN